MAGTRMKTGYHYTSWSNWLSIKEEGLRPYVINKPELRQYFPGETIRGIWTWLNRPQDESELGSIMFQMSTKQETKIVCLEFQYRAMDTLEHEGRTIKLFHDGHIGSWMYHQDEPAIIAEYSIPPTDIKLLQTFDLMDVVRKPVHIGVDLGKGSDKAVWSSNV